MLALAFILLLAADSTVELVDDVHWVPAHEWRYVELGLKQRPGRVSARFDGGSDNQHLKLALMRRDDLDRLRRGLPHEMISETAAAASGVLNFQLSAPGDYVVVVNNLSAQPARVHLRIWVQFPRVTTLSRERRMTVVAISFAFFFGIVMFSARKLLRGIRP